MAKNHQTENPLFKALIKQSEAAIIKSMQCQLDKIATAEKRIDTLNKHFNNTQI